jgi:DNA-binding beta-propeller fold protein YncE
VPTISPSAFQSTVATGPGGQIAWLQGASLTGFDANGHIVATIDTSSALRSPDGNEIYVISGGSIQIYSASTGKLERTITRRGTGDTAALSPEGRYLVTLGGNPAAVEVIDLVAGRSITLAQVGAAFTNTGLRFLLVAPQASRIFAFTDFWQHAQAAALSFDGSTLRIIGQASDGQQGHSLPSCDGMASENSVGGLPERLLPDGKTMVSFCPGEGLTSWVDLDRLTVTARVRVAETNPFWLSPVFSPDGSMLYVQEPGTGRITSVDLHRRKILRSETVNAPTALNPLHWLADHVFPPAYAGGIPRTAVISADGNYLYVTGGFGKPTGIGAVRLRDFSVAGEWKLEGGGSLWLSADGRTLYALNNGGDQLSILHFDSGAVATKKLPGLGYDFLTLPR